MTRTIVGPVDLKGWDAIAGHLDVHVRTAQRWLKDGLPVSWFRGRVQARSSDLDAWVSRQTVHNAASGS